MKKSNLIFIIIFILLLILPAVSMPFFANSPNTENRNPAPFPMLTDDNGSINVEYFDEFDAWVNDHIGFRNIMVKANTAIHTGLFGHSPEESVVLGSDGWLYYEDTVKDYVNIATISERNAYNIASSLAMVQDYVRSNESTFVFTIMPDKAELYGDNMPYYYHVRDARDNKDLLEDALLSYDVNYVDMFSVFENEEEVMYQTTDSHWNYKGALMGYNAIMSAADYPYRTFDEISFEARKDWQGDLGVMLYSDACDTDVQLYPDYEFSYEITSHETAVDSINLSTTNQLGNGNVLLYRDSFANTMQIYFEENFENAFLTRSVPYNMSYVTDKAADVTVIEIVERNIPNLCDKAPIMPAPIVSKDSFTALSDEDYSIYNVQSGNMIHFYGDINEDLLHNGYEVCIGITGADGVMKTYRAFPIYETELMGSDSSRDNGFSVYVPAEDIGDNFQSVILIK